MVGNLENRFSRVEAHISLNIQIHIPCGSCMKDKGGSPDFTLCHKVISLFL